jgi:hypothetical protein
MSLIRRANYELDVGRVAAMQDRRGDRWTIPILDKCDHYFDGRIGSIQDITVAQIVNTSAWASAVIQARWYGSTSLSASAQISFVVQQAFVGEDDPGQFFTIANPLAGPNIALTTAFTAGTAVGSLETAAFANPIGPYVRVFLRFAQGATPAGGQQKITVGVSLIGRPG